MANSPIEIDLHRLDEEWLKQPILYHEYADRLANARRDLADAQIKRDIVEAECKRQIRKEPEAYGIEKSTEDQIRSTCILQPDMQESEHEVVQAKHAVDVLAAMVDALDHRKKSLENLVQLHGRDYFASPKVDENNRDKFNRMERDHAFKSDKKTMKRR